MLNYEGRWRHSAHRASDALRLNSGLRIERRIELAYCGFLEVCWYTYRLKKKAMGE
jgi:hypothetical protein